MQVLFTHGYFLQEDPKEQAIMRPYPPLGLLYLSAWLEQHGIDNEVFDSTFSNSEQQRAYLLEHRPPIIAIYTNLMSKQAVVTLMQFIRAERRLDHSLIVLGGPDVTHNAENYLRAGADLLIIGEGEQSMLEVAQAVLAGGKPDWAQVPGLAFIDEKGLLVRTPSREKLKDLDELPLPNRHKIELSLYLNAWKKHHGQSALSLSTQRGCPYTCRWCSTAVYGQSYRRRSPASVVAEMKALRDSYQPDLIWFVDDVFTVSHKWLNEFRDTLRREQVQIPFECITRADRLNPEVVQVLKDCGCFRVWIGAESGSQRIIDAMDRRVSVEKVREMIRETRRQGMQAGTFIMLGYPGETEADIRLTLEHLKSANPDLFTITVAYPIKGTGLYEAVESLRLKELDWQTSSDRDIEFVRSYSRGYYDFAVRWVVNGVNYHKARLAGRAMQPAGLRFLAKALLSRAGMYGYRWAGLVFPMNKN